MLYPKNSIIAARGRNFWDVVRRSSFPGSNFWDVCRTGHEFYFLELHRIAAVWQREFELLEMQFRDWITILALILGPVLAVGITLWVQQRAQVRNQRIYVFQTLLAYRQDVFNAERVRHSV